MSRQWDIQHGFLSEAAGLRLGSVIGCAAVVNISIDRLVDPIGIPLNTPSIVIGNKLTAPMFKEFDQANLGNTLHFTVTRASCSELVAGIPMYWRASVPG